MSKMYITVILVLMIFFEVNSNDNEFISYQSIYEVSLDQDRKIKNTFGKSFIKEANGELLIDWFDNCDSWVSNQRMYLRFINSSGVGTTSDINYSLIEKYDGSEMEFALQVKENNMIVERVNGKGKRKVKTIIDIMDTKKRKLEFESEVIFPHAHLKKIIRSIKKKNKIISHKVYEGSIPNKFLNISTFISDKPIIVDEKKLDKNIKNEFWVVRMAYYDENKDLPEMELTAHINKQGFVNYFKYDYPRYSLEMKLRKVQFTKNRCN